MLEVTELDPTKIQPLGDRVLVEVIIQEVTRGGIILPSQTAEGRPERAKVLAVGPGRYNEKRGELVPVAVEVGDEVIFHRLGGTHIGGLDDSFIVFREQDLLCKVRADESDPE